MADAPEIKVKLTAEDTGVSAAIKELGNQLKNLKSQQEDTASSSLNLSSALQTLAASAVLYKIAAFGKEVFDAGVQIAKTSQITGASAQTISVFHKAASDLGIDAQTIDLSFVKLSKSILLLQQGSKSQVAAFGQLGLSAKDFIGLNTDQKIKLVTDRLGSMAAGTNTAAVAQVLLGKGGAANLPVLQALAGEGFGEVEKQARAMGLLLDNQTAASLLSTKKAIADLADEAGGAATQIEVGLMPALTNVASAMVATINGSGGGGFKELGEEIGSIVEKVSYGLITDGQLVAEAISYMMSTWDFAVSHMKESGIVLADLLVGDFGSAYEAIKAIGKTTAGKDLAAQFAAIHEQFLKDNDKANLDVFGGASNARPTKPPAGGEGPGGKPPTSPTDAAAKAQSGLDEKQMQDRLSIQRAYASESAQVDKEMYDAGEMSLAEYYGRRRAEVANDTAAEYDIVQQGLVKAQAAVAKATAAKSKAATPKDADKQEAARLEALGKVDELQTKMTELQIANSTKITALDAAQFKEENDNNAKILEFHKEIDQSQGKSLDVAKQEIALETQKMAIILRQAGESEAQVQAEVAKYSAMKTAQAEFDLAQKKTEQDQKAFELEKQAIEIKARAGQITSAQKEKEINDLIRDRLPLLRADAAAEVSAAQTTGSQNNVSAAQNATQGVQNLSVQTNQLQQQIRGSLTTDFNTFFMGLGRSTASAADQFRSLAASIVQSLEQIILKKMLMKALGSDDDDSDSGGGGGGGGGGGLMGILGGLFHFAEGGLIKGPGGPKSDSIPARVSPGEYIVKADAVSAFGVHNLEAINRGLKMPSLDRMSLPKFAEGGLVGNAGVGGGDSNIHLGISLEEGLVLKTLSSKNAGNIVLQHLVNNPKAASKALGRSQS